MGNPVVLAKYRQFTDDFNSGVDRAQLCAKYDIPEQRFDSYLEFLRRKGYSLDGPTCVPPPLAVQDDISPAGAEKKRSALFARIDSAADALKMARDAAYAFYFVAALQGVIGFFILKSMILDGLLYAVLAFFLHRFSSRVAALLLFLMACLSLVSTVMNRIGAAHQGGGNIFLALIVLVISARAIEATFKLRGHAKAACQAG